MAMLEKDFQKYAVLRSFDFKAYGYALRLVHTGTLVWASFSNGSICTFHPGTSDSVQTIMAPGNDRYYVLVDCVGVGVVVALSERGLLHVWDRGSKSHQQKLYTSHEEVVKCGANCEITSEFWSGDTEGNILVWKALDDKNFEESYRLKLDDPVLGLEEADGTMLVGTLGRILQIHATSFQLLEAFEVEGGAPVGCVLWVRESQQAWTYSDDEKISVWSSSGELVNQMAKHTGRVQLLHQVPALSVVMSGSFDLSIIVWDAVHLYPLFLFEDAHQDTLRCMSYSAILPCDFAMVSGAVDGVVHVWSYRRKRDTTASTRTMLSRRTTQQGMAGALGGGGGGGGGMPHRFKQKTFKRTSCAACPRSIKGSGLRCKACRMDIHNLCQGLVGDDCPGERGGGGVGGSKAFPGIALHSMIDTDRRDSLPEPASSGAEHVQVQAQQTLQHEQEVRIRFLDTVTGQPVVERLVVATRKAASAKDHVVAVAVDVMGLASADLPEAGAEGSGASSTAPPHAGGGFASGGSPDAVGKRGSTKIKKELADRAAAQSLVGLEAGRRKRTRVADLKTPIGMTQDAPVSSPLVKEAPPAGTPGEPGNAPEESPRKPRSPRVQSEMASDQGQANGNGLLAPAERVVVRRKTTTGGLEAPLKPARCGKFVVRREWRGSGALENFMSVENMSSKRRAAGGARRSAYVLKIPQYDVYILKDDLPLHRLQYIQACKSGFLPAILDVVPTSSLHNYLRHVQIDPEDTKAVEDFMEMRTKALCTKDLQTMASIRELMDDCPFHLFVNRGSSEVMDFRRALTIERMNWYGQRERELMVDTLKLPRYYTRLLTGHTVPPKIKLEGYLYLPDKNSVRKTLLVNGDVMVEDVRDQLFQAIAKTVPTGTVDGHKSSEYILKIPGCKEFLYGPIRLVQFDAIRNALSANKKISLRLIRMTELEGLSERYAEPPVYTLADTLLSQDTAKPKESPEKPIDIYTLKNKLSVQVVSMVDIPAEAFEVREEDEERKREKERDVPRHFCVGSQVMLGGNLIDLGETEVFPVNTQVALTPMQGTIEFHKLRVQDIPRGSRLGFTLYLREGDRRTPLYWVNVQLVHHDSKSNTWSLRAGKVTLSMWRECEKGTINLFKSIGLCSENVTRDAPKLNIVFPELRAEVVFPPAPRPVGPEEVLARLKANESDSALKKDLFHLREKLKEPDFKEPFIAGDGLRLLCNVVRQSSGNILSYALGGLEVALEVALTLGRGYECITSDDIEHVVKLTDAYHKTANPNLNAAKAALRFLHHMIDLPDAIPGCHLGFPIVYDAILAISTKMKKLPFSTLMKALSPHDDIDITKEALRLVNSLLEHCPDELSGELRKHLHRADFHRVMKEVIGVKNMETLVEVYRYQKISLCTLEKRQAVMYDTSNPEHEEMLMRLWTTVFPKKKLKERVSAQWGDLGFQGKDPATDFRGMGILGLDNLLYIATEHKKSFREILSQYSKTDGMRQYPVACAGVEISDLLFQMLEIGKYRTHTERIYKILFDHPHAIEEMYVMILKHLNKMWYEMKAGYMDFPNVKAKLKDRAMSAFSSAGTLTHFRRELAGNMMPGDGAFILLDAHTTVISETIASRMRAVDRVLAYDSLARLSAEEKRTLWQERHFLTSRPGALFKFLQCVNWHDHTQVLQCYRLLHKWAKPTPHQAIELLDARYTDPTVREYAVNLLDELSDEEVEQIVLQLCQVLKYEAYHDSALARFILRRAYRNHKIGHRFFWNLRAELHIKEIAERYSLLLEAFVRGCGPKRGELLNQHRVMSSFTAVARKVKATPPGDRRSALHAMLKGAVAKLRGASEDGSLLIPLDERLEAKGLVVPKCKSMDSKQVPLWLVFENVDPVGENISIILKVGDDLRQDALTLQMMRLMDQLWKKEGMNLGLRLYGCVATGNELGMLEVVKNAETTAGIQREAGGAKSVLQEDVITKWLLHHNPGTQFQVAQSNFARSCAGYSVATYVLGIADRHNDNIMVDRDGHIFHIDFGHFLGNYKKKFGYKRETTPFVFTAQYAHVLRRGAKTSDAYEYFKDLCVRAYNIVRHNAGLFLNLFQLMLCGGIHELQSADDINHLRDALALGLSDEEAGRRFKKKIAEAQTNKRQKIMDVTHLIKH